LWVVLISCCENRKWFFWLSVKW